MSARFEPKVQRLEAALSEGLGGGDADSVRGELGLSEGAEDRVVARSLVQILAACHLAEAGRGEGPPMPFADAEDDEGEDSGTVPADSSLLGRIEAGGRDRIVVDDLDLTTLLGLMRAGTLRQRRAALRNVGERLESLSREEVRLVIQTLETIRDVEIDQDVARIRERLGGPIGRKARAERERWRRAVATLEEAIETFWNGERSVEPISDLPGDERALLLLRAQELPDSVVYHLTAVLEGDDGVSSREDRRALLESIRYAGDARLVPSLVSLLDSGSSAIVQEAARALRRIDDPRVRPAMRRAYDRIVVDVTRTVVAGALAGHGDKQGLDYVRDLLEREDAEIRMAALEALETLGGAEDTERVAALLEDRRLAPYAVATLARIGDGRALLPLHDLERRTKVSAMLAAIDEARTAIRTRMELRGEEVETEVEYDEPGIIQKAGEEKRPTTTFGAKIRALRYFLMGQLWIAFGAARPGIARLERAAHLRPDWARPWVAIAMSYARRRLHAKALGAFRRAIEVDRRLVERNPLFVRALAQCFLRRAEQVEREGRRDVARGLLGEVLDLDLRRAPSAVRFELQRRRKALQRAS